MAARSRTIVYALKQESGAAGSASVGDIWRFIKAALAEPVALDNGHAASRQGPAIEEVA